MSNQESSASRVAGKGFRIFQHAGKRYILSQPLRMSSYADQMALVLSMRRDPMEFALRAICRLSQSFHASVWEGCAMANMPGIPSKQEWQNYDDSVWKQGYMLWVCLDPKHKINPETKEPFDLIEGVTWAVGFITGLPHVQPGDTNVNGTYEQLMIYIGEVSQDDAIKNSSGPPAAAVQGLDPAQDDQPTTECQQSTNSSPLPNTEA